MTATDHPGVTLPNPTRPAQAPPGLAGVLCSWRRWTLLLVAAMLFAAAGSARAGDEGGIQFLESVDTALRQAIAEKRVTAVYFSAPWCTWCQKMSVTSFVDPRVMALAARMVWAKVDIQAQPEVAAQFQVMGVPQIILLNTEGQMIGSRVGYLTAEQLASFLRESVDKAEPAAGEATSQPSAVAKMTEDLGSAATPDQCRRAVAEVVEQLARPDRQGRLALIDAVSQVGPAGWRGLALMAGDERLAVRAAAGEALMLATGEELPFDPFGTPEVRKEQLAAWQKWIDEHKNRAAAQPAGSPARQPQTQPSGTGAGRATSPSAGAATTVPRPAAGMATTQPAQDLGR